MSRIITINRQFGSGGRELGKRLAEEVIKRNFARIPDFEAISFMVNEIKTDSDKN